MVLGMIFVTGIGMAGKCGFSQRNILISAFLNIVLPKDMDVEKTKKE